MTKLWLKLSPKVREQIVRVGRLFGIAVLVQLGPVIHGTEKPTWAVICSGIIAAAEAVFRQFVPVTPVAATPSPPPAPSNVTIVPALGVQPPTDGTATGLSEIGLIVVSVVVAVAVVILVAFAWGLPSHH